MQNFLTRLKEPSTWAGLSVLIGLFGVHIAPEVYQGIVQIATGAAAVGAVLVPEVKQ